LDDHVTRAPITGKANAKAVTPSSFGSDQDLNCQAYIGDWHFESTCKLEVKTLINRLVGNSRSMMGLRARIIRYAETEETVLISGETGTGKELIARLLHDLSPRRRAPFIAVNCATIPSSLAESELFGNTKGAYTGAFHCRTGLFSKASGGTLFLDEFGELAPEVQSKLLRSLELGLYRPVGANREERADVRIVAATNRDLQGSVGRGEFRADLYYRISVLQIQAPPLRMHPSDIPYIAGAILGGLLPEGANVRVTESVMTELLHAPWPGNVRELKNVLRRALVMSGASGVIEQLDGDAQSCSNSLMSDRPQSQSAVNLISVLTRNKGHIEAVARELNVSVRTIQRRMKESGLRLRDFRTI